LLEIGATYLSQYDPPVGVRFSHNYLPNAALLPDSKRMRRRIGHLIGDTPVKSFGDTVAKELGIAVSDTSRYGSFWPSFVEAMQLRDALDVITIRYKTLKPDFYDDDGSATVKLKAQFLTDVRRVFVEEQVRYRVDPKGGVHFTVDTEFERSRVAAIVELGRPRYKAVLELFDGSFIALDSSPPDAKSAIRSIFFSTECLFRLMFPNCAQLNAGEMQKHLKPKIDEIYDGKRPAIYVAHKQVSGFREWIDAAHFYRHEAGKEEPEQPPLEIAIEMISQGAAFIRWLARIDARAHK
jgi:hypothetical protein